MRIIYVNKCIDFRSLKHDAVDFYFSLLSGVADAAEKLSITCEYADNTFDVPRFLRTRRYRSVDGVIGVIPWEKRSADAWAALERRVPCVSMTNASFFRNGNYVGTDDRAGVQLVMDHLFQAGCRSAGYIGFRHEAYSIVRYGEFIRSAARLGVKTRSQWCIRGSDELSSKRVQPLLSEAERSLRYHVLLSMKDRPDAVVFENDVFAAEFYQAAREHRCSVPGDIMIAGLDGTRINFTPHGYGFLTAVRHDFRGIGSAGVRMLYDIVRKKRGRYRQTMELAPTLIPRTSTERSGIGPDDRFRSAVVASVETRYAERSLAKQIAMDLSLTPRYFLAKFGRVFGRDFSSFLNDYRIDRAAFLLANTAKQITEVVWEVGFHNHQNFNKFFKRRYHLTPTAYRARRAGRGIVQ